MTSTVRKTSSKEVGTDVGTFKHVFTKENPGNIGDYYTHTAADEIGSGSYGKVYKGECKRTGAHRALKAIEAKDVKVEEIRIQQSLDHPNIVKLYETFKDAQKVYLVMEMCIGGELFDRIIDVVEEKDDGTAFDETQAATYMQQIIGAMRYLHDNMICHRDIKPENFLMQNKTKEADIKVIDFGLAKKFSPGVLMKTKAGTPYYVAPQVLSNTNGYDHKCDVWSCGVICYILLCGVPPFYGDTDAEILDSVKKGEYEFASPEWDDVSKCGKTFIDLMLIKDDQKRPAFDTLCDNKWLSDHTDKGSGKLHKGLGKSLGTFHAKSKLKKIALTCIAQQLGDSDIQNLKESFKTLDVDGSGTLTIQEIRDGMQKKGVAVPKEMEKSLNSLDTDGSGCIDYTEFIAATLEFKMYQQESTLWAAFRVFDKDGDGTITKEELREMATGCNNEEIVAMIKEADTDGNGEISFDEFKAMMKK